MDRTQLHAHARLESLMLLGALLSSAVMLRAQPEFQVVLGKDFDGAVPRDFYLEGNAIPVEKRNTVLLKTASGARVLVGLIDTAGYSSQIQQKYIGMLIAEIPLSACNVNLPVGSYGFGLQKPRSQGQGGGQFLVYDQAGKRLGSCPTQADQVLSQPRPLQVAAGPDGSGKLFLGRYWIALRLRE